MIQQIDLWKVCKIAIATVVSSFTGLHAMIQLLLYAIAFDVATGVIAGWINKTISSDIGRKGVGKKVMMLLGVSASEIASRHIGFEIAVPWGGAWGLGAAVAGYYALQEAISIVENLARAGVPLPQFVVERLQQLQESTKRERGGTK